MLGPPGATTRHRGAEGRLAPRHAWRVDASRMTGPAKKRTSRKRPAPKPRAKPAAKRPPKRKSPSPRASPRVREAELAILDSVQKAIAAALDLTGIYEAVG